MTDRYEKIRAVLTAAPAAQKTYPQMMPAELSQFLSDVMTAAGLVSHGKQCKALGERLGDACMRLRLHYPEPFVAIEAARGKAGQVERDEALLRQALEALEYANDEVVFIDGVGAGRRSVESCRDGVQWIMVGNRVYWPLSESDAKRLQSACCGNGHFDGPSTHVGEGEQQ